MSSSVMNRMRAWPKYRTTVILALALSAEHADMALLSSMYLALQRSLHVGPTQLGELTMWRGIIQAITSPFSGVLGDVFNRVIIITIGTLCWGAFTTCFGFAHTFQQAIAFVALTGLGLALVLPSSQSVIADLYAAQNRGRAFGLIFTLSAVGGMASTYMTISISNKPIHGVEGWRIAVWIIASVSVLSAFLSGIGVVEPRALLPPGSKHHTKFGTEGSLWFRTKEALKMTAKNVWVVLKVPSFMIICAEHVIGSLAWAQGYRVMYFQLVGFSDGVVAYMTFWMSGGAAIGFLIGGALGDAMSKRYPNAARPFIIQLSMVLSIPLTVLIYKGMPAIAERSSGYPGSADQYKNAYGVLMFAIGCVMTWSVANNSAIFAEVVPPRVRTSVYAFDKCVAGLLGALASPLVGVLAERCFGYKTPHRGQAAATHHAAGAAAAANNAHNALALERGLLWVSVAPMLIKLVVYTGLYWSLPRDRARLSSQDAADEDSPPLPPAAGGKGGAAAIQMLLVKGGGDEEARGAKGGMEIPAHPVARQADLRAASLDLRPKNGLRSPRGSESRVALLHDVTPRVQRSSAQAIAANTDAAPVRERLHTWDGAGEGSCPARLGSQGLGSERRTSLTLERLSTLTRSLTTHLIVENGESQFIRASRL